MQNRDFDCKTVIFFQEKQGFFQYECKTGISFKVNRDFFQDRGKNRDVYVQNGILTLK